MTFIGALYASCEEEIVYTAPDDPFAISTVTVHWIYVGESSYSGDLGSLDLHACVGALRLLVHAS